MDAIDREILGILQQDARIPNNEIAKRVGIVPSATSERIRKLASRGLISNYETRLNSKSLGFGLVAFIFVRSHEPVSGYPTAHKLSEIPEVQEVHNIAGEDCYLIKVRVRDTEYLSHFLREKIGSIPEVHNTRTIIALETFKETSNLPIQLLGNGNGSSSKSGEQVK